ncbi:MAG: hypothetical protein K940chlam9_00248 [Chlamydiae bacterium]|nr:hypothetical protein [Chlamydiota bacterium]
MRICQFQYICGARSNENRVIFFKENEQIISAEIYALLEKSEPIRIGEVANDKIFVDSISAKKKMEVLEKNKNDWEALQNLSFPEEKPISFYEIGKQKAILNGLASKGQWSITVQNHVGDDPRFETVVQLHIFKK